MFDNFINSLQNAAGVTPGSTFGQTLNQLGNITPTSTTLSYNNDGSTDITHKMTVNPVNPADQSNITNSVNSTAGTTNGINFPQYNPVAAQILTPQTTPVNIPSVASIGLPQSYNQNNNQIAGIAQSMGQLPPIPAIPTTNTTASPESQISGTQPSPVAPTQPATQQNAAMPQSNLAQNAVFNSMLQAESGGQDYNPDGTPVTSSAGAKYAAQVMPSTAFNPGYGITPAANDSPQEFNRVGRDYFQKMLDIFGGDYNKAVAAYHAGESTVNNAVAQAQTNGGNWTDYLGPNTKNYVNKVNPDNILAQINGTQVAGPAQIQSLTGNSEHDRLINAGSDINQLNAIAQDPNVSDTTRQAAYQAMNGVIKSKTEPQQVQQQVQDALAKGDNNYIASLMRSNPGQGSPFRAMLYELAGAKQAANEEYNRLGYGASWVPVATPDGHMYAVYSTPNGTALGAIDSATGEKVDDPKILSQLNGYGSALATQAHLMPQLSKTVMYNNKTGEMGQVVYDPRTRQNYLQVGSTRLGLNTLQPGEWSTIQQNLGYQQARINLNVIGQLQKKFGNNILNAESAYEQLNGPLTPDQRNAFRAAYGAGGLPTTIDLSGRTAPGMVSSPAQPEVGIGPQAVQPNVSQPGAAPQAAQTAQPSASGVTTAAAAPGPALNLTTPLAQQKIMQETRKDWIDPNGNGAKQVQQLDRGATHADALIPLIQNLNNTNSPIWNSVKNSFETQTGQPAPTTFDSAKSIVADEIMKTVIPGGATGNEREHLATLASQSQSPQQLLSIVNEWKTLMSAQATSMERLYNRGTGLNDFRDLLGPSAQAILDRGHQASTEQAQRNRNTRSNW